jgi:hypothetical protein
MNRVSEASICLRMSVSLSWAPCTQSKPHNYGDSSSSLAQMQINFEAGWRESVVHSGCRVRVIKAG